MSDKNTGNPHPDLNIDRAQLAALGAHFARRAAAKPDNDNNKPASKPGCGCQTCPCGTPKPR